MVRDGNFRAGTVCKVQARMLRLYVQMKRLEERSREWCVCDTGGQSSVCYAVLPVYVCCDLCAMCGACAYAHAHGCI